MTAVATTSRSPAGKAKSPGAMKAKSPAPKEAPKEKTPSKVDRGLIEKAVDALLKYHEEQSSKSDKSHLFGTDAAVQIQFALEVAPQEPSHKPIRIMVPHPLQKTSKTSSDDQGLEEPEVCLIVKEDSKPWVQEIIAQFPEHLGFVKKVLGLESLRKKYKQFAQRRELLHKYTIFLADDRILPMLTTALGRDFIKAKKQPIPISITKKEALPLTVCKALSATYMFLSAGTCLTIRAGNTGMPASFLVDNLMAIVDSEEGAVRKIPRQWANVRSIGIKTPSSTSLPVYNKTPEELIEIAKMAGLDPVWKKVSKEEPKEEAKEEVERKRKTNAKSPLVQALKKQKQLKAEAKSEPEEAIKTESNGDSAEELSSKVANDDVSTSENKVLAGESASKKAKKGSKGKNKQVPPDSKEEGTPAKKAAKKAGESSESTTPANTPASKKREKDESKTSSSKKAKKDMADSPGNKTPTSGKKEALNKNADQPKKENTAENRIDKNEKESVAEKGTKESKSFIPSSKFAGSKPGYVYRKGKDGSGYYMDVKPVVDKMAIEALGRNAKKNKNENKNRQKTSSKRRR